MTPQENRSRPNKGGGSRTTTIAADVNIHFTAALPTTPNPLLTKQLPGPQFDPGAEELMCTTTR